jgi:Fe-S-cluster containining protein
MKTIPAFTCQMCGHCCKGTGGIVVSPEEQDRLCRFLDIDRDVFLTQYTEHKSSKYIIRSDETGYCIFFKKGTGCAVHPAKPDVCRAWPFFRGNLVDQISWEMAQDYCPGICGDVGHKEFVRQGLAYLKSHHLVHHQALDANALKIEDIEEAPPSKDENEDA